MGLLQIQKTIYREIYQLYQPQQPTGYAINNNPNLITDKITNSWYYPCF